MEGWTTRAACAELTVCDVAASVVARRQLWLEARMDVRVQGSAALINSSAYLESAAGILAIEAYHAGSIREQLIQNVTYVVEPYNVTVGTIVDVSLSACKP